jgi:hypothetical protein
MMMVSMAEMARLPSTPEPPPVTAGAAVESRLGAMVWPSRVRVDTWLVTIRFPAAL